MLGPKAADHSAFLPINKKSNLPAIKTLAGLGAVGILLAFDQPIMDAVQGTESQLLEAISEYGNNFGEVTGLGPLILGSMGIGLVFDNDKFKNAAVASIGSLALGQLIVEVLKSATHRQRPNKDVGPYVFDGFDWTSDNTSFPSGHSAAAWSVATIFAEEFKDEYLWSPYVAYGLAAMTSYARVHQKKH